ncbi:MAG: histidine phosphatase family protein [Synergistaceae bacterium]|nr:histidine phosphatase family protein [Synergistaceae bacterium]
MPADKKILLIRHGRTDWNDERRFQGISDVPLNAEGTEQAALTSARLASERLGAVYTSPLSRAHATASAIAAPHGLVPTVVDSLAEVGFGVWETMPIQTIKERDEEFFARWLDDPFFTVPEGGEDWSSARRRIGEAADVVAGSGHASVAVVSHGGVIRALFALLLGFDPHSVWSIKVSNCSLTGIERGSWGWQLAFSNDDLHLSLPKGTALPVWRS